MKVKTLALTLLAAGMGSGLLSSAHAADLQTLEKQLQMLQKEIAELKAAAATKKDVADLNDQVVLQGKESVVAGDIPGSFRMPGSETSTRIYGYAEANLIKDFGSTAGGDHFAGVQYQPLKSTSPSQGLTQWTAQTSRFGFETSTPTRAGALHTQIEGDFVNYSDNRNLFRLRHAYGEYAGWLIGQTWSTAMDGDNFPETVDFNGPIGAQFSRPVQIRYTYNMPDVAVFKVAVEGNHNGSGLPAGSTDVEQGPTLVLRADRAFSTGAISARLISHSEIDTASGKSARGTVFALSGSYKISEMLTGFAQYTQGDSDAGAAYIYGANGVTTSGNDLLMDRARGVVLGLNAVWNEQWRSTLSYGQVESLNDASSAYITAAGLTQNRKAYQWHAGFYYTPLKGLDLGAEYIGGSRQDFNGDSGDLSRLNLQARYSFN